MNFQVSKIMLNALSNMSEGVFQGAAVALSENKKAAKEEFQKETSLKIKEIINKLSNNSQISLEDIALIKLWIIGDAQSYTEGENNLNDWIQEYKRLADILVTYENRNCSAEDLFKLSGLLEDAVRVSYDIANFLEKKDRVSKFQLTVSEGLDREAKKILVNVLTGKLISGEY